MSTFPRIPNLATGAAVLALAFLVPAARANELGASAHVSGFVIHDAEETLRDFCTREDGKLFFQIPGGARYELVTSTNDPAILNPGDGAFHPYDAAEVKRTLDAVRFPLEKVSADIFLLPYPRRGSLESAAGPGLVLLAPGVRPLPVDQMHSEFVHELGHVVQYALMPDDDGGRWQAYRTMRGITDRTVFSASAAHHDRPHEIFAEDFRVLFGDARANYSGSIENTDIAYPTQVGGLDTFMAALGHAPLAATSLAISGDGRRGQVQFARGNGGAAPLDLFDVTGRRVATVLPSADATGSAWTWDGRDAQGRPVSAAILFARARDGQGGTVRFVRLP